MHFVNNKECISSIIFQDVSQYKFVITSVLKRFLCCQQIITFQEIENSEKARKISGQQIEYFLSLLSGYTKHEDPLPFHYESPYSVRILGNRDLYNIFCDILK